MANRWNTYSDDELYEMLFKKETIAEQAFSEIYNRYSSKVFTFCKYFLGNYDDASDVFQETFIKFHKTKKQGRQMTNMRGYLLRIARNLCLNYQRDNKKDVHFEDYMQMLDIDDGLSEKNIQKLGETIKRAIEYLPDSYKEIFILREYDGLSYNELTEVLGETLDTVRVRLYRAKQALRKALEPQLAKMQIYNKHSY